MSENEKMEVFLGDATAEVRRFAEIVYEPGDVVEERWLPSGHQKWGEAERLVSRVEAIARANSPQHKNNIYLGVNPRIRPGGSTNGDVAIFRVLVADFDGVARAEADRRVDATGLPEPTMVVNSGHGYHYYWRLAQPLADAAMWTSTQKALAAMLGSDPKIFDPARIMRLPGFYNWKKPEDPVLCRIVLSQPTKRPALGEIMRCLPQTPELIPPPPAPPAMPAGLNLEETISKARAYISKMPPAQSGKGGHNQLFRVLSVLFHGFNLSAEGAWPLIMEYNGRCLPPWSPRELEHKIKDVNGREDNYRRPRGYLVHKPVEDEGGEGAKCSYSELAEKALDQYPHLLCYHNGVFHQYERGGNCWRAMASDNQLKAWVRSFMDDRGLDATMRKIEELLNAITHRVLVDSGEAERAKRLIAFRNGFIDPANPSTLLPPDPTVKNFNASPFDFVPGADAPRWKRFIKEVLADSSLADCLQEFAGYCLTAETWAQKALYLVGRPGSGKSTVLRNLVRIVGPQNCCAPSLKDLGGEFGLQALVDKRVAELADAHMGKFSDSSRALELLKMVIGEDGVDVHVKHRPPLTGQRLAVRFVISANEFIRFPDTSGSLVRRLLLVPMNAVIARPDPSLDIQLEREASGIINWAVEGYIRLKANRAFTEAASSRTLLAEYAESNSPVLAFLSDRCIIDPAERIPVQHLWDAWRGWAAITGHEAGCMQAFGSRLRAACPSVDRQRESTGQRARWYVGITLREGQIQTSGVLPPAQGSLLGGCE